MRHPDYHLRPNKAVDRLTIIEAIKRIAKVVDDLSEYTYYSLGGPYLEDFRLLYEFYPEIKMVSIEEDENTYKRQQFHVPCRHFQLRLQHTKLKSFLAEYEADDQKSIFWLDYPGLDYGHFDDFMALLGKVVPNSIIKMTLRCNPRDYHDKLRAEEFKRKFEALMPDASADPPSSLEGLAILIQEMIHIASQRILSSATPLVFLPLSSFYYSDGTGMFTLTGVVCLRAEQNRVRKAFKTWQFVNLDWIRPKMIDVPVLSTKERLHLQRRLPSGKNAGRTLRRALGYLIDENREKTEAKLQQYADYHRYFPYFMKAIP